MATWVAGALGGVDPSIMGIGPVASTKKVMAKTGLKIEDFDVIEANEAFAAQSVAVSQALNFDMSKVVLSLLDIQLELQDVVSLLHFFMRCRQRVLRQVLLLSVSVVEWAAQQSLRSRTNFR